MAVEEALKTILELFVNKARTSLSEKLKKDGGLNAQDLGGLIASSLDGINSKLDGIARQDLLNSLSEIKKGLFFLNGLLDRANTSSNFDPVPVRCEASVLESLPDFDEVFGYVVRFKRWLDRPRKDLAHPDNLDLNVNSALVQAVNQLKWKSLENFNLAMKCFDSALKSATAGFNDESLNLEDRILAAKLRIYSGLLLSLQKPNEPSRATVCKLYLEELHDLPAIEKIFRSDVEGGLLSQFNKAKRHELVQRVTMINFVLFRYLNSFTGEIVNAYNWPLIGSANWMYNPLIPYEVVLAELQKGEVKVPNIVSLKPIQSKGTSVDPKLFAINSEGDLILFRQRSNPDASELVKFSGNKVEVFYTFFEFTLVSFLAIDDANFVRVFADDVHSSASPGNTMYVIYTFDPEGQILETQKHCEILVGSIVLCPTPRECGVALCVPGKTVSKEKDLQGEGNTTGAQEDISIQGERKIPGKTEISGTFMSSKIEMWESSLVTIIDDYEVIMVEQAGFHVRVFNAMTGRFVREFKLHGREREACVGITFNNLMKHLIVVSRVESDYFLSAYLPTTGERCHIVRLAHIGEDWKDMHLTSHRQGPMALITKEHALYIQ